MNIKQIKATFRTPAASDYPELQGYTRDEIYESKMGPGGLYLAAQMSRRMGLAAGQRVLDLGCGGGASSVFLAKRFGVAVVAVDLVATATDKYRRFQQHGVEERVIPLNLDITEKLPFATSYFDAIFCMDSVHYYGGSIDFWAHLLPHLKPGGILCLGSPCFNVEFTADMLESLPVEYDDGSGTWTQEFSRYHSPEWWRDLLAQTGLEVLEAGELKDGIIFWEDDVLHNLETGRSVGGEEKDADQIWFRRDGMPYLTHFVLCAREV